MISYISIVQQTVPIGSTVYSHGTKAVELMLCYYYYYYCSTVRVQSENSVILTLYCILSHVAHATAVQEQY